MLLFNVVNMLKTCLCYKCRDIIDILLAGKKIDERFNSKIATN